LLAKKEDAMEREDPKYLRACEKDEAIESETGWEEALKNLHKVLKEGKFHSFSFIYEYELPIDDDSKYHMTNSISSSKKSDPVQLSDVAIHAQILLGKLIKWQVDSGL
jgi:hypothetical protein